MAHPLTLPGRATFPWPNPVGFFPPFNLLKTHVHTCPLARHCSWCSGSQCLGDRREADGCEFSGSLAYTGSSRPAQGLIVRPCLSKTKCQILIVKMYLMVKITNLLPYYLKVSRGCPGLMEKSSVLQGIPCLAHSGLRAHLHWSPCAPDLH